MAQIAHPPAPPADGQINPADPALVALLRRFARAALNTSHEP